MICTDLVAMVHKPRASPWFQCLTKAVPKGKTVCVMIAPSAVQVATTLLKEVCIMKNNNVSRNIRVVAENNGTVDGFNIYLDFSGQREFLMFHRHNGLLYELLKDGIRLDDLGRLEPRKYYSSANCPRHAHRSRAKKLESGVNHLQDVITDYILERNYYRDADRRNTVSNIREYVSEELASVA